jgi:uncharacterized protein
MQTVLITGGTGLVGAHLCKRLQEEGYDVAILSRKGKHKTDIQTYTWDWSNKKIEKEAIDTADCIIHLAGASVGDKKWTANRRQVIVDSRVKTGQLLFDRIKEQSKNLKVFVSASAIGYYGTITSDKIFMETDPSAEDFLGSTCRQWEEVTDRFKSLGIRTVKIRTGVVLTQRGGALSKMITPVSMGIGSAIGDGRQYLPWIHVDDLCGIYIKAIKDAQMNGAYNAVAPDHKTNREFMQTLARVLKKPFSFPNVPAVTMKLLFGKMSTIILKGSRVSADKIVREGYHFLFPELEMALNDLLKSKD